MLITYFPEFAFIAGYFFHMFGLLYCHMQLFMFMYVGDYYLLLSIHVSRQCNTNYYLH